MTDKPMDKEAQAEALLQQPILARLATASPKTLQPHVVPVWFYWDGECIWISAFSSTRKVKDLRQNLNCAVLIEPASPAEGLQAVLFEGTAELIAEPREQVVEVSGRIYARYADPAGTLTEEMRAWTVDPENTIIKLKPARRMVW